MGHSEVFIGKADPSGGRLSGYTLQTGSRTGVIWRYTFIVRYSSALAERCRVYMKGLNNVPTAL